VFNGVIAIVVGEEGDVDWYVPNWVSCVALGWEGLTKS
jgi:hypothetical protein